MANISVRSRVAGALFLSALLAPVAAATTTLVPDAEEPSAFEAAQAPGTWEIRPTRTAGTVHLQLREDDGYYGSSIELTRLSGLATGQLNGAGPVGFSIHRDAGTFTFDGVGRNGVGAGTFTFSPDRRVDTLIEQRDHGVTPGFITGLSAQGLTRLSAADLLRARDHGVDPE